MLHHSKYRVYSPGEGISRDRNQKRTKTLGMRLSNVNLDKALSEATQLEERN